MKYGDLLDIKCKYCGWKELFFLGEEKDTYMIGSKKEEYKLVMCPNCGIVHWASKNDNRRSSI